MRDEVNEACPVFFGTRERLHCSFPDPSKATGSEDERLGTSPTRLAQHWLSDVLGGYAVAAMLLVPYCWAYTKWRLDATRRRFKHAKSSHG